MQKNDVLTDLPETFVPKRSFSGLTQQVYEQAIEQYQRGRRTAVYWAENRPFDEVSAEISACGAQRDLYELEAFDEEPQSLDYGPASLPEGSLFSIDNGRILMHEAFYYALRMRIYHDRFDAVDEPYLCEPEDMELDYDSLLAMIQRFFGEYPQYVTMWNGQEFGCFTKLSYQEVLSAWQSFLSELGKDFSIERYYLGLIA